MILYDNNRQSHLLHLLIFSEEIESCRFYAMELNGHRRPRHKDLATHQNGDISTSSVVNELDPWTALAFKPHRQFFGFGEVHNDYEKLHNITVILGCKVQSLVVHTNSVYSKILPD
ncbi:unnamed protein product [Fraxinus pennsylvanica]|uniref:Uncharacterized protein n=1 Tax=Fraxinus pennsylvanica TaxID=56036 RepID=A0AAD2E883_9LAMI|nr:unnamed protein product [Fraxinus pennsylvanica]